jgi:hypothetical protein
LLHGPDLQVQAVRRELSLPLPASDAVSLFFWTTEGKAVMMKLHKGQELLTQRALRPFIPWFIRLLTDDYELRFMWWELIECARKMTLVGAFTVINVYVMVAWHQPARGWVVAGLWLGCGWVVAGSWLGRGWVVAGSWLGCGWVVAGLWLGRGWVVTGSWLACGGL